MHEQTAKSDAYNKIKETFTMNQILLARKPLVLNKTDNTFYYHGTQMMNPKLRLHKVNSQV